MNTFTHGTFTPKGRTTLTWYSNDECRPMHDGDYLCRIVSGIDGHADRYTCILGFTTDTSLSSSAERDALCGKGVWETFDNAVVEFWADLNVVDHFDRQK